MPNTTTPEQWPVQSQPTHRKCKGDGTRDHELLTWKKSVSGNRKQITGTVTCSKSADDVLGLCKQDNTNGLCCWRWANPYPLSKQCRKLNNWNNEMFKVYSKCIGIIQRKWHRWCMLMTRDRSLYSGNICNDW